MRKSPFNSNSVFRTLCPPGRLNAAAATQLPFAFDLRPTVDAAASNEVPEELFETYHGVKVDVEYSVKSEVKVMQNPWATSFFVNVKLGDR